MNPPEVNSEFEALLDYLKHRRGCDLTVYKRSTLMRRFRYRMQNIKIDNYQTYLKYLEIHPEEYRALLNDILINFSGFFRDREAWDYLATDIIPKIIISKQPDEPIRVWSAGCAAGQEIYSLLILLAEALGIESCLQRVQCYATDADELVLRQARHATYAVTEVAGIPPCLLERYFQPTEQGYVFHAKLRHTVIFGQHDLTKDAPISQVDLLMCRNVLIYFNSEAQRSILVRFHFALKNTGFLFLGKAESLISRRQIFTPINLQQRVYAKGLNLEIEDYLSMKPNSCKQSPIDPLTTQTYFWQVAFEASAVAQLAVDINGYLIGANEQANILFSLTLDDCNRPFLQLEPGKLLKSHAAIKNLYRNHHPVTLKNIERITSESTRYFDVAVAPVFNSQAQLLGITLTFLDTTECKRLAQKLEYSNSQLQRASEVLQATESELDIAKMQLEAAEQEIQFLTQDARSRHI